MLKKLFKYDFLWLMKTMPYYYIAVLVLSICTLFTDKMYHTHLDVLAWLIVDKIFSNLLLSACFAAGITILIRSFVRFKNNLYRDESYLTHTLPVSKSELFGTKVLSCFSACVITVVVIVIGFLIPISDVKTGQWFIELFNVQNILLGVVLLEEVLCFLLCMFAGVIIGNRSVKHKVFTGVLMAGLIYLVVSQVVGIGLVIAFFADTSMRFLFHENPDLLVAKQGLKTIAVACSITYGISCAGVYLLDNKLLNKGVNVD